MTTNKQKELIEALRSGKYKQGKSFLRKGKCFCAGGLACEISGLGKWVKYNPKSDVWDYCIARRINTCCIPDQIVEMFDIDGISVWNDHGLTFEQIADILEERWK